MKFELDLIDDDVRTLARLYRTAHGDSGPPGFDDGERAWLMIEAAVVWALEAGQQEHIPGDVIETLRPTPTIIPFPE